MKRVEKMVLGELPFTIILMAVMVVLFVFMMTFSLFFFSITSRKKQPQKRQKEVYIEIFTSPGCVNCPAVKKMLEEISKELEGDITIEEVDVTIEPTRAAQYGIMSVPAVAVNGILKFVGAVSKEELKKAILEELNL